MFTITLDEALKIYAEPKRRGRQGAATPPLRELGNDSVSGKSMSIKDGRFGPYVTDGETNASLRKGDDVLSITDERASELLADRRARGPATKRAPRAASKTTAAKSKSAATPKSSTARTTKSTKTAKTTKTTKPRSPRSTAAAADDGADAADGAAGPGSGDARRAS